jgi:hypothetical protein
MNRRRFSKQAIAAGAVFGLSPSLLWMEGCSFNVTNAINAVLNSLLAILKVAESNATWLNTFKDAVTAFEQAETQWKNGSSSAIVTDALNTVEAVLAVIPATAVFSPLIDIVVAAIEAVISAFGSSAQLLSTAQIDKRKVCVNSVHYKATALKGPNLLHPTWTGAYKAQWNSECARLNLLTAKI